MSVPVRSDGPEGAQANLRQGASSPQDIRVLFLVDDISRYGGVRTRVMEELSCLSDAKDIFPFVIARCNFSNIEVIGRAVPSLRDEARVTQLRGFAVPKVPHAGIQFLYELSFLANTLLMLLIALPVIKARRINLIYGHNNEQGFLAILLGKILGIPTVVDIHGVEVDEYLEKYPSWSSHRGRIRFWRNVESFVGTRAGTAVCVSDAHLEELRKRMHRRDDAVVLPCFADESIFDCAGGRRNEVRSSLGVGTNETLFVYSGIVSPRNDHFNPIRFFSNLKNLESSRLLILAADPESIERVQRQSTMPAKDRVICVSVPRLRVPEYLCACDVAILLRRRSIVNRVASPTKFAEYLLCGLPVVISDELGDASELVNRERIGVVLSEEEVTAHELGMDLTKLGTPEVRSRARRVGLAFLSRAQCRPKFLAIVRRACESREAR